MSENSKKPFDSIKTIAKKGAEKIDISAMRDKAVTATEIISDKTIELKDAAVAVKDDISDKLTELDRLLNTAITEYNDSYTLMNDKGLSLYVERTSSLDVICFVEDLVNSIANHPKEFDKDIEEITVSRKQFSESRDFAERELKEARNAANSAGAGLAAGASVAFMAPTAAMWVATTFGTASTGTAISTLSGAAATNAALAWLGGGALAAGGHGMAAGSALLALAGPVGWSIAGASLLSSILLFTNKRMKLNKEKNAEIEKIKKNTETIKELDLQLTNLLDQTRAVKKNLNEAYLKAARLYACNYTELSTDEKLMLGTLVNNTKSLSALMGKQITTTEDNNG